MKRLHNRLNFIPSVHPIGFKCFTCVLPLDIKNPPWALRIPSPSELISSDGMNSMSLMEWSDHLAWDRSRLPKIMSCLPNIPREGRWFFLRPPHFSRKIIINETEKCLIVGFRLSVFLSNFFLNFLDLPVTYQGEISGEPIFKTDVYDFPFPAALSTERPQKLL